MNKHLKIILYGIFGSLILNLIIFCCVAFPFLLLSIPVMFLVYLLGTVINETIEYYNYSKRKKMLTQKEYDDIVHEARKIWASWFVLCYTMGYYLNEMMRPKQ